MSRPIFYYGNRENSPGDSFIKTNIYMATVNVKFRPSHAQSDEGTLYYQVIHNRVARQIRTGCRASLEEWEQIERSGTAVLTATGRKVAEEVGRIEAIIASFENTRKAYAAEDIVRAFAARRTETVMLLCYIRSESDKLKERGKTRLADAYGSTANSFSRYRNGIDIPISLIDADLMSGYEAHLQGRGMCKNSSSFYMRNLRAIYNRAVDEGLTEQRNPFRQVYTGVDKTVKRAVPLAAIKKIKRLDLSGEPLMQFARDMFMFSFYTRGMSFVDMAFLKKSDLRNGILTYRRKKTGQLLNIKVEKCMQDIIDRYATDGSSYLLSIIKDESAARRQYLNASHLVNRKLKAIGEKAGLSVPLTMYVARHAWASIAKSKNIPMSIISEGMGHDNEKTTRIYLAELDTAVVDKANRQILKEFE